MERKHVLIKSRIEYTPYALNYYEGCRHGCRYCYARIAKRLDYHQWRYGAHPVPNALDLLRADLDALKEPPADILISSSHDPYQWGMHDLTRSILEELATRNLPASVLTKGGLRACYDLDLLQRPGARLGVTITTHSGEERVNWEPAAAPIYERLLALTNAKLRGVATWVSVEPILPGLDLYLLARQLTDLADWVVIGRWNYSPQASLMDWPRIREAAQIAFNMANIPYLIKRELREE